MTTPNRPRQLHFWVTDEALVWLRDLAKALSLSSTQYVRYVLQLEVERHRSVMKGKSAGEMATIGTTIRTRAAERDRALQLRAQANGPASALSSSSRAWPACVIARWRP